MAASDEKLEPTAAERAFFDGDWAASQRLAKADLAAATDEKSRAAARATLGRFRIDPLVPALYGAAILFFVLAILHWSGR